MNEIKITTPAVVYEPAKVLYDFAELDNEIVEIEKRYKNWLPSESEIKDAEKVAKDINGVATNLNNEKVRIKKEMNAESKKFEDETMLRVNQLKSIRQNVIDNLDVYEQKRIKERKESFDDYVKSYCMEIGFEVPSQIVFETKVTNKSCTQKQYEEIAKRNINDHKLNYDLLCQMDVEDKELLQSIYLQKWDRLSAIDEYNSQIEARKRAEEIRKQREEILEPSKTNISNDIPVSVTSTKNDVDLRNEMVCIKGENTVYKKCKAYALSLGLSWEEL